MATTYYVDNVLGNDGNAGTSEGAGNAWQTIQHAADNANTAGDIVYVKNTGSNYTFAAVCDLDTNSGSATSPISFIGYTTTPGDNGRPTIVQTGGINHLFNGNADYLVFKNFIMNATGVGYDVMYMSGSTNCNYENVKFYNGARYGLQIDSGHYTKLLRCEFDTCANTAIYGDAVDYTHIFGNYIHDCGVGIHLDNFNCIGFNILYNNSNFAIQVDYACQIFNNTIDAGTAGIVDGVKIDADTVGAISFFNNIVANFDTAGKYGVIADTAIGIAYCDYNAWYNNDTDTSGITKGANAVTLTELPYTADNFSLNNTAGAGAACRGVGFQQAVTGATSTTSYIDLGAVQVELPSSPTTPTFGGITGLERVAPGQLKASWSAGSNLTCYKIFVRKGSAPTFDDDTYLWGTVDDTKTSVVLSSEEDNDTLLYGDEAIYVGVRAHNEQDGSTEDNNTTTLNITPDAGLILNGVKIQVLEV